MTPQNKHSSNRPIIEQDVQGVNERQKQFAPVEKQIEDYTASVSDVIGWYYSQDPLNEQGLINLLNSTKNMDMAGITQVGVDSVSKAMLYENAAAILIGNLFFPDVIGTSDAKIDQVKHYIDTEKSGLFALYEKFGPDKMEQLHLDKKTISQMAVAGDMMIEASRQLAFSRIATLQIEMVNGPLGSDFDTVEVGNLYNQYGQILYHEAAVKALENDQDPKSIALAMELLVRLQATNFNREPNLKKGLKHNILHLITFLESVLQDNLLEQLDGSVQKGRWHETLWFVDFAMFGQISNKHYMILPSNAFEDCPHANYPKFNRGFDYRVGLPDRAVEKMIQLKSSPKARKSITHPTIETVIENDFSDEPAVILEKLRTYRRYIESGFAPKQKRQVGDLIMGSVKTTAQEIETPNSARGETNLRRINEIHELGVPVPTINRAMRRAFQRQKTR